MPMWTAAEKGVEVVMLPSQEGCVLPPMQHCAVCRRAAGAPCSPPKLPRRPAPAWAQHRTQQGRYAPQSYEDTSSAVPAQR